MKELKYKMNDEVLVKCRVIGTREDYETTSFPYNLEVEPDKENLTWRESFSETSIVGKVEEFVKVSDQKTYEQGLNDAWEMARIIIATESENGIPIDRLRDIYGSSELDIIAKNYTAQEAINIYNDWKEHNVFKMGDIVEVERNGTKELGIFYHENDGCFCVLLPDYEWPQKLTKTNYTLRKVGESGLDIAGALKKVREME